MNPTLSIVIVTYKPSPVTHLCFWSLEQCHLKDSEVIVVDNSGPNPLVESLAKRYPFIHLHKTSHNSGFGRACNKGFELSNGKYILFLNPDAVVPENMEAKLIAFFKKHPSAGAMGVKMIDAVGQFLPESKRNFPTPIASFLKFSGISRFFPAKNQKHQYYAEQIQSGTSGPVPILSGAFMAITRKAMTETGGFDPRFFLYAEDIDLSYQITQKGLENWYNPEITILHLKGETSLKEKNYPDFFYGSMKIFYKKHFGQKHNPLKRHSILFLIHGLKMFSKLKHNLRKNPTAFHSQNIILQNTPNLKTLNYLKDKTNFSFTFNPTSSVPEVFELISTNETSPTEIIKKIHQNKNRNLGILVFHEKSGTLIKLNGKNNSCQTLLI